MFANLRSRFSLTLVALAFAGMPLLATDKAANFKPPFSRDATITEARLTADISFLAGDECEGRGIATKGIHKAADHIAGIFKEYGLKPGGTDGYFQPFEVAGRNTALGSGNAMTLVGPQGQQVELKLGQDFITLAGGATGEVEAPVVFAGFGLTSGEPAYDDFANLDVEGKVVVVLRRLPRASTPKAEPNFSGANAALASIGAKVAAAQLRKAAAVLFVNDLGSAGEADALVRFNYPLGGTGEKVTLPVVQVRRAVVNQMLKACDTDLKQLEERIDRDFKPQSQLIPGWTCKLRTSTVRGAITCKNVIGVLEGQGPLADETVVIGAHYDHLGYGGSGSLAPGVTGIHYGADDNASGTTCVLELARRFAKMENRQGRRLMFMLYSAEETGLLGSAHYCKNPTIPLEKTVAMVNLDMVGRYRDEVKLQVLGITTAKGDFFKTIAEKANDKPDLKLTLSGGGQFFAASDHYSFYLKNVPVVFLFTGMHPQYHKPVDQVPTINITGMRRICDLTESMIEQIATGEKPEFVKLGAPPASTAPRMRGPTLGVMPNYGDEKGGLLLDDVRAGGLAEKAGLKKGDRITEISGKPIQSVTGYMTVMGGFKKGDEIEVTFQRDGKTEKVKIKLE